MGVGVFVAGLGGVVRQFLVIAVTVVQARVMALLESSLRVSGREVLRPLWWVDKGDYSVAGV